MKKVMAGILTCAVLCTAGLPAGAFRYSPEDPQPKTPEAYAQAAAEYQVREALRLGLVPAGMESGWGQAATRQELAETALTAVAAHYGYDLENFLAVCTQVRPQGAADTAADAGSDPMTWAAALGLLEEAGSPNAPAGSAAASVWSKAAALCGAASGAEGKGSGGSYTRQDCLEDAVSLFTRAGRAKTPLLTLEEEAARLEKTFSQVEVRMEHRQDGQSGDNLLDEGVLFYGDRNGSPALSIAYDGGGARTIHLDHELRFTQMLGNDVGYLYAFGPDNQVYAIDLTRGSLTPVAGDERAELALADTAESGGAKNQYGKKGDGVIKMVNGSAAPHTLGHLEMEVLNNNGGTWQLSKGDQVVLRLSAPQTEGHPGGQRVKAGYLRNGEAVETAEGILLGECTLSLTIPESGAYTFYLDNRSSSPLYLTSTVVEILHPRGWELTSDNDVNPGDFGEVGPEG